MITLTSLFMYRPAKGVLKKAGLLTPKFVRYYLLFSTRGLREAMCIALFAMLPGFASYEFDRRIDDTVRVVQSLPSDALWIDARSQAEYAHAHVPGALSLNEDNWDHALAQLFVTWQSPRPIIVYCSEGCSAASQIAKKLIEAGFEPVEVYEGGFEKWKRSKS